MFIKDLKVKSLTIPIQTNFSTHIRLFAYFQSANGTFVNDTKIELEVKLEVNDRVGFGKFIAFHIVTPFCQGPRVRASKPTTKQITTKAARDMFVHVFLGSWGLFLSYVAFISGIRM